MNFCFYFKGIKFHNYKFKTILSNILSNGGYLVAPAASALSSIDLNKEYYNALKKASTVILDSGFFCKLVWFFRKINCQATFFY